MSIIQINDQALRDKLLAAATRMAQPNRLTAAIANSLLTVVEDNFDSEGRPAWAGLSAVTLARRKAGKMLYQSGKLRGSIVTSHNDEEVMIGTNDPKAPTHQFGAKQGQYGRSNKNKPLPWGNIPARPFIPIDASGNLQPEAEQAIFNDAEHFYQSIFD